MNPAPSVHRLVDVSVMPPSHGCMEDCHEEQAQHLLIELSLLSQDIESLRKPYVEDVRVVSAASSMEVIQGFTDEQQQLLGVNSLDTPLADYKQASVDQLLAAARASDERAFVELSGRFHNSIRNRVFRILRNREDTEDVLQDALLKAYQHLGEFKGSCKFSTWLTKIAINSALMALRKRKSRSEVPIDQRDSEECTWETLEFPDPYPNPEQVYTNNQVLESVTRAISHLPPTYRNVLELYHRHEQSLRQCADAVGISVAAAKSRLLRARLTVRSTLEKSRVPATDACC
jgi:RNA polymerase sigma-70 factor (ECF subfamily)